MEEFRDDGKIQYRIVGTKRIIDGLVKPEYFGQSQPVIIRAGDLKEEESVIELIENLRSIEPQTSLRAPIDIPLPEPDIVTFPSNPAACQIVADTPTRAWLDLLSHIKRHGIVVDLPKGQRQELLDVKVVINNPVYNDYSGLEELGLNENLILSYQEEMIESGLKEDKAYA